MADPAAFPLRSYAETEAEARANAPGPTRWARLKSWLSGAQTKAADDFISLEDARFGGTLPRTQYLYGKDVGKGLDSNVIMSPVSWVLRNFTEAEPIVERRTGGQWVEVEDHPLAIRLAEPNPFYDGDQLWKATLVSYLLDGNGYWLKRRNAFGAIAELWYLPHHLVEPRWPRDGTTFISHYAYTPEVGGPRVEVPTRDIVHFRYGLDPRNTRKGLSPLRTLLREVFTDEEAANFSASLLRNMGVPGGVIGPKDINALPSPEDVERMKEYMKTAFTGDRRGEWFVVGEPTEIQQFGFDPNQLMLTNLRDITEERVCAAIGIPAAVVGFGAGLQQTKVGATMKELRRSAWANCIIPNQNTLGRQSTRQLIPEYQAQRRRFRVAFDRSMVSAFPEEDLDQARRYTLLVEKGVMRVDRAQERLGLEVDETQAVYLRPSNAMAVEAETAPPMPAPSPNGGPPAQIEETARATNERANRVLALLEAKTNGG